MNKKDLKNFSISPIKKNHIILLHENSLLKRSQQLIFNSSINSYNPDNPMILKKFQDYFNNHPVKDLKMMQAMINKNNALPHSNSRKNPAKSLMLDLTYEKRQYDLIGINTLKKKTETNPKTINIQREDKKLILKKPSHLFASNNQMNFTVNPVSVEKKNSSHNLKKIKNYRSVTGSIRNLKMTTSIDISKYINGTTVQEPHIQNQDTAQESGIKIHFRNSSDTNNGSQNRQLNSKTLQYNKEKASNLISRRLISKNKLQQSYRDKAKYRQLSPLKKQIKVSIFQYLNPIKKTQFVQRDLLDCIAFLNNVRIKNNMNGLFFNVFIQEGNNSQLLKTIMRSVCGWRVVQLPETANFIWTQIYRKKIVQKRPNKIIKDQIIEEENDKSRSQSKTSVNHRSRIVELRRSSKQKDIQIFQNYIASIKPEITFENQLKKVLPPGINPLTLISINKKNNQFSITPNFLIHNHLPDHKCISDKKNLLKNLKNYYQKKRRNPFQYIPQSYHISNLQDQILQKLQTREKSHKKQVWLIKPGQDSNRGKGIVITKGFQQTFLQLRKRFQTKLQKQKQKLSPQKQVNNQSDNNCSFQRRQKSVILQRYIMPLLYNERKFDIRSYMLVTVVNNNLNAYFYQECYMRTSSRKFDINTFNKYIHLTNDAIQCLSNDYGKFQEGNKLSQIQFRKYLFEYIKLKKQKGEQNESNIDEEDYWDILKQQMMQRCKDIIQSTSKQLFQSTKYVKPINKCMNNHSFFVRGTATSTSPKNHYQDLFSLKKIQNTQQQNSAVNSPIFFELFGLDFLIDEAYKLWLIEVNTNPAITHDCSRVLNKLIPRLLQNTLAVAVMPYMKPSRLSQASYNNQFINIFSQRFKEDPNQKTQQAPAMY